MIVGISCSALCVRAHVMLSYRLSRWWWELLALHIPRWQPSNALLWVGVAVLWKYVIMFQYRTVIRPILPAQVWLWYKHVLFDHNLSHVYMYIVLVPDIWRTYGTYTGPQRGHQQEHSWWRHQMETFSALLAHCAGNSPVTGEFPSQRTVTRRFDVFFDLCLNKRLSKQSWRR